MKKIVVAVVACWCVALTGCGDDAPKDKSDDKASESEGTSAKDEFIKQGDAICAESNPKIDAATEGFADPQNPTPEEITTAVNDVLIPEIEGQVAEFRKLTPPVEDTDRITAMLGSLEVAVIDLKDDPTVIGSNPFAEASMIAQDYGFKECGKS